MSNGLDRPPLAAPEGGPGVLEQLAEEAVQVSAQELYQLLRPYNMLPSREQLVRLAAAAASRCRRRAPAEAEERVLGQADLAELLLARSEPYRALLDLPAVYHLGCAGGVPGLEVPGVVGA